MRSRTPRCWRSTTGSASRCIGTTARIRSIAKRSAPWIARRADAARRAALDYEFHLRTETSAHWHKAEEFDGATIATAIQGYNRHAKRVPGMPALHPKAQVNGPCRWASLFQLFPYESIDAHLSVARKWGRLCRIDEPISVFLDVPDHRCSSP